MPEDRSSPKVRAGDMGLAVPADVPDCGWIPRFAVRFGEPTARLDGSEIIITTPVRFTLPFTWITMTFVEGPTAPAAP
jgi:hypothetical protein